MSKDTQKGVNGNWTTAADWRGGVVSGSADDVYLSVAGSYTVSLTTPIAVASITISDGGTALAISDPGQVESVTGDFSNSGILYIDRGGASGKHADQQRRRSGRRRLGDRDTERKRPFQRRVDRHRRRECDPRRDGTSCAFNLDGHAQRQRAPGVFRHGPDHVDRQRRLGFGTAGVETGHVSLENDVLLEFQSGRRISANPCKTTGADRPQPDSLKS